MHIIWCSPSRIFETTPEIAHKCGLELAERLFADKYEVVVATHLDHKHLHNHLIINSVSYADGYEYRNNFKDYFHRHSRNIGRYLY
ncbi:MAG: relaxase/mobilization nuclease domain-containing protein [Clostridiales bacterium]|nr:MAG: relaxase/mobilization nuclease domain-containing protein [Clostridiales bacterium]